MKKKKKIQIRKSGLEVSFGVALSRVTKAMKEHIGIGGKKKIYI